MSGHTPGTWDTDLSEHDAPYQDIVVRSGTRGICTVWIDDAPCNDYNAEQRANARLIAASPDLLEVLQELEESSGYWSEYDVPLGIVDRMRAAIAKATGEQK